MRTLSTRGRRYRLWLRTALACLLLGVTTLALVGFEVLVLAIITYVGTAATYALFETIGFGPASATTLAIPTAAAGVVLGREGLRAVSRVLVERDREHELRRYRLHLLFPASIAAVSVLASAAAVEIPPAVGFVAIVLVGISLFLWAITQLDAQWPPDDATAASSALAEDIGREFGRRIGYLETRLDSKTVGTVLAALALAAGLGYGAVSALDLASETVFTALSLLVGTLLVGSHHAQVARNELDEAAVLRRLCDDLDSGEPAVESTDHAALERRIGRLTTQVDAPAPTVRLVRTRTPTAAAVGYRPETSTIVVSTGLLDALDDRALEAVLAHEVAHVANRDATVLTLLSAPGAAARETVDRQGGNPVIAVPAAAVIATSRFCAALVARGREYAADDGAVAITGDPAALASALETLDDRISGQPRGDLRGVAAAFSIVPQPWSEQRFFDLPKRLVYRRILGTHPKTARRVERLKRRVRALENP